MSRVVHSIAFAASISAMLLNTKYAVPRPSTEYFRKRTFTEPDFTRSEPN